MSALSHIRSASLFFTDKVSIITLFLKKCEITKFILWADSFSQTILGLILYNFLQS
jgi:hypothetical protein